MASNRSTTQTGVGASDWLNIGLWAGPSQVSGVAYATGAVLFTVEYTYDDFQREGGPRAIASAVANETLTADFYSLAPITGIRVNISAGDGTVEMVVLQGGGRGTS